MSSERKLCELNLLVCSLFNDDGRNSKYIASNDLRIVNNERERMWKKAVFA